MSLRWIVLRHSPATQHLGEVVAADAQRAYEKARAAWRDVPEEEISVHLDPEQPAEPVDRRVREL